MKIKKPYLEYIGFAIPFLLGIVCLITVTVGNYQAFLPIPMPQQLIGEYSYDGENWQTLTEDTELSAREKSLFLRGTFSREMQEGWLLNFYSNHIGVAIKVNGEQIFIDDVLSIPDLPTEVFASICAREWRATLVPYIGTDDVVEIYLENPHMYGNKTAYNDFLTTLCSDPVDWNLLEQNLAAYGEKTRILGMALFVASLMILGAVIAAVILKLPITGMMLKLGLMTFAFSGYVVFDSIDISYWSDLNVLNTYAGQLCMMLAAFCLCHFVSDIFVGKIRTAAKTAVLLTAILDSVFILLSFTGVTVIYDTMPYWVVSQIILCPIFIIGCVKELLRPSGKRLVPISALLLFSAFLLDIAGVGNHIVWRTPCTKIVFSILFVVHIIAAAKSILIDYRASARAKKLEKELEDSRIAIMLSQIKPHFLYNVLNTIYHLYRKEPETAQEAVSSFAEYLRCNMLSIEKNAPIPFSAEYQHIQTYLSLEQIRFREKLDIVYDIEVTDFKIPPLTVEPLVENAVKHGVTKKRGGGVVTISTRRTADRVLITVRDNGVGFDPEHYMEDGKEHVGIRNIKQRLQAMVGGSLDITSSSDGTIAVVTIPVKEARNTR